MAERAGLRRDSTAEPGAEAGPGRRPGRAPAAPDRVRVDGASGGSPGAAHGSRALAPMRPWRTSRARCSSCRAELAIDTDVARRIIREFIRGQLRQAGFERALLGLSGGIDSALVAYLVAEAIGAGAAAVRPHAVPHVVARIAHRRRGGRGDLGCASELVDISADGRRLLRGAAGRRGQSAAPGQLHGAPG